MNNSNNIGPIGTIVVFIFIIMISAILAVLVKSNDKTQPKKHSPGQQTKQPQHKKQRYIPKKLMTKPEIEYGNIIRKVLPNGYRLFPQICLASILNKTTDNYYVSELFRIIDFVIFDLEYNPVLLIEINDKSHHQKKRIKRDFKIMELCEEAKLPLIRFWMEYGINENYIKEKINEYL